MKKQIMKRDNSYKIEEVALNPKREINRLEGQLDLFWNQEIKYLRRRGLSNGMKFLDCGSGPGHMLKRLAKEFPSSEINGLEFDPLLVEFSREMLKESGSKKCRVYKGSVLSIPFENNQYDFIVSRLVLEHLSNPLDAVKEMLRVLKPEGTVVLIDNDFAFHLKTYPDIPELGEFYEAYCKCRIQEGGRPYLGRELPNILSQAGFDEIELSVIGAHNQISGDDAFMKSEGAGIASKLIKDGYLNKITFNALVSKWRELLLYENHSIFRQLFYSSGKKVREHNKKAHQFKREAIPDLKVVTSINKQRSTATADTQQNALNDISGYIGKIISTILKIDPKSIKMEDTFEDIGLDSLSAATIKSDLESKLDVNVSLTEFFSGHTIKRFCEIILEQANRSNFNQDRKTEQEKKDKIYYLSYNQESLWFQYQMDRQSAAYNVAAACRTDNPINQKALQYSLNVLIDRHKSLRTTYHVDSETFRPFQRIHEDISAKIKVDDAIQRSEAEIKDQIIKYYQEPFDLENGPLLKVYLVKQTETKHILMFVIHHIACDAWSLNILIEELLEIYEAHLSGHQIILKEIDYEYTDFVKFQRRSMDNEEGDKLKVFWQERLAGFPQRLTLPYDFQRPKIQRFTGKSISTKLNSHLYSQLTTLAKKNKTTLYSILLSTFQILLMGKSGQRKILLGTIASGRTEKEFHRTIGYFVNPLVIAGTYDPEKKYSDYLTEISDTVFRSLDHQAYPFSLLVEKMATDREMDIAPIFQIMFNMLTAKALGAAAHFICPQDTKNGKGFGNAQIKPYIFPQQEGQFDMTLEVIDTGNDLFTILKYNSSLFKEESAQQYLDLYCTILNKVTHEPDISLLSLDQCINGEQHVLEKEEKSKLAIAGTFTTELVEPALNFWLKKLKMPYETIFAPYNQIFQQLLDPSSLFIKNKDGMNIILIRFEDWIKDIKREKTKDQENILASIKSNCNDLIKLLKSAIIENPAIYIVLICPPSPIICDDHHLESRFFEIESDLCEKLNEINGIYPISHKEAMAQYPIKEYYEPMGEDIGHIPYTQEFFDTIATYLVRKAYCIINKPYKVIVLDCDNTLWNGVVGEDGVQGIIIDKSKKQFQEFIVDQQQAGRIICLCSKNNENDVMRVFRENQNMVLKEKHIAAHKINWSAKSLNLKELSQELNLGLDSFIFIDDNPIECAEVNSQHPDVLTIQVPEKDRNDESWYKKIWAFDILKVTEEDTKRNEFYRNEHKRGSYLKETTSYADFINGLNLELAISDCDETSISRICQLTQRVNQFNFTTIRRNESEIANLCQSKDYFLKAIALSDRFGDYGLVGTMITKIEKNKLLVDSFILSCRALGKGVEYQMISQLGRLAIGLNLDFLEIKYIPTERNTPALNFINTIAAQYAQKIDSGCVYLLPAEVAAKIEFEPGSHKSDTSENNEKNNKLETYKNDNFNNNSKSKTLADIAENLSSIEALQRYIHPFKDTNQSNKSGNGSLHLEDRYGSLISSIEWKVADIWKKVLRLKQIGRQEKFFEIGGKSVLIPQIVIELKKQYNIDINIVDVFQYPDIKSLSAHIQRQNSYNERKIDQTKIGSTNNVLARQRARAQQVRSVFQRKLS
jgi:FkbH-like protein